MLLSAARRLPAVSSWLPVVSRRLPVVSRRLCTKPATDPGVSLWPRTFNLGIKPDDGVPLVTGSLIDRVHKLGRACIHQGLLHHCGRGLLFVAILSDEWSIVRLSLTSGAICSVAFHFLFPFPRPARMAWASVFAVGHLCALYRECKENLPVSLTDDERQLYAQCFEPVGFTPWHFRQIMALAKPVRLEPGDVLCEECEPVETVALLLEGSVNTTWRRDAELGEPSYQLKKRDRAAWDAAKVHHGAPVRVAAPAKGGGAQQPAGDSLNSLNQLPVWVGEIYEKGYYDEATLQELKQKHGDAVGTHRWRAGEVAVEPSRLLVFPRRELHDLIEAYPLMREASLTLQTKALWLMARARQTSHVATLGRLQDAEARAARLEEELRAERERRVQAEEGLCGRCK